MAGYGINAVRFHKFTWDATDEIRSTQIMDANRKNFDFFCNELRQAGIYYSWSHIYGHRSSGSHYAWGGNVVIVK